LSESIVRLLPMDPCTRQGEVHVARHNATQGAVVGGAGNPDQTRETLFLINYFSFIP